MASPAQKIISSGGSPIPIAFSLSDTQTQLLICDGTQHVLIQNDTNSRLAWGVGTVDKLPTKIAGFIIKRSSIVRDKFYLGTGSIIFIRSDTGNPITNGVVMGECW